MARRKKRNASRGSVNNIILKTLASGDKYGYEIIKEVEEYSDGKIQLKQPSLYSSLTRFEEKKFVTSYWGDSDIGGRRHYYHITEEGLAYYRKFILKDFDESIEEGFDIDPKDESDDSTTDNVQDINNSLDPNIAINEDNSNKEDKQLNDNEMLEIDESEIPAIANFNSDEQEECENPIPDHIFRAPTPIESMINSDSSETNTIDNTTQAISNDSNTIEFEQDNEQNNEELIAWQQLVENTKKSNKVILESKFKRLYIKKPKKIQKVVKDIDGIYKLRDEDYVPKKQISNNVVIDNVIKRSKSNGIFGYTTYTEENSNSQKSERNIMDIPEEEKLKRNENFLAKFNLLTMSKMKPVSTPAPKPIEETKPEKPIDYRSKLNAIYENNDIDEDDAIVFDGELEQNNIYNYTNQDEWKTDFATQQNTTPLFDNNEKDPYVNLEESQQFEIKQDDRQYIEEINNHVTPPNQVKMTRYEHTTKAVLVDKTYLLNNKLKFVFGIIMSILMIAEVTITWLCFKKHDIIMSGDKPFLIGSFCAIGLYLLYTILPFIINSNSHKANNFKFKYNFWFGILTFLVCTILIYCINALNGFEIENIKYFAVKLFLPIILAFNFIIAPIVYGLLVKNKKFYD